MAITVTGATIYKYNPSSKTLTSESTPAQSGSVYFYRAGYYTGDNCRYSTLLTCTTTTAITNLSITLYTAGWDGTTAARPLGVFVVKSKNDNYLKTTDGGDGIIRFAYEYTGTSNIGSASSSSHSKTNLIFKTSSKVIPANSTFYIYIVPYNSTNGSYSTFYDAVKTSGTNTKAQLTGSVSLNGSAYIYDGSYKKAIPWVYNGSSWVMAIPWVYNGGWKQTKAL